MDIKRGIGWTCDGYLSVGSSSSSTLGCGDGSKSVPFALGEVGGVSQDADGEGQFCVSSVSWGSLALNVPFVKIQEHFRHLQWILSGPNVGPQEEIDLLRGIAYKYLWYFTYNDIFNI